MREVARRAEKRGRGDREERAMVSPYRTLGHLTRQRRWDWLPHGSGTQAWSPPPPPYLLSDLVALACPVLCREEDEKTA